MRKSYGHRKPMAEWVVVRKERHEGYIDWVEFERTVPDLAGLADDLKTGWNAPGVIADGG